MAAVPPVGSKMQTPGVYINDTVTAGNNVIGAVPTAWPAFVGYTQTAMLQGKDWTLRPFPLQSMAAFQTVFGGPPEREMNGDAAVTFSITPVQAGAPGANFTGSDGTQYRVAQGGGAVGCLYRSMELFFANGGGECSVVSVGDYADVVDAGALSKGLTALATEVGPTLLVVPDAVLLKDAAAFGQVAQQMLAQCGNLQDRFAIVDVFGAQTLTPGNMGQSMESVLDNFKAAIGAASLDYGAVYFPFLETLLAENVDVDYTFFGSGLAEVLQADAAQLSDEQLAQAVQLIAQTSSLRPDGTEATAAKIQALSQALAELLPAYVRLQAVVREQMSVLPPSGAVAGFICANDAQQGVWTAPAGMSLQGVTSCTVPVNDAEQSGLNAPADGKAINAIRFFPNQGIVVWGARTLDSNSDDWRYISVRRLLIMIEQSVKAGMRAFVFQPNEAQTWAAVVANVSSFLTGLWREGGLVGSKPAEAFAVQCGLGSTMTGQDILDGYMKLQVQVAVVHPAEFIVITCEQQMASAA